MFSRGVFTSPFPPPFKTRSPGYSNKWILIKTYYITNYKLALHITVSHINPFCEDISTDKWLRR